MKLFDKIQELYWAIVPYRYRPSNLIYYWANRLFKKYTTCKPRYLSRGQYADGICMEHFMFEVFSKFCERELFGREIWGWGNCKLEDGVLVGDPVVNERELLDGTKLDVNQEIKVLYKWWHEEANKGWGLQEKQMSQELDEAKAKNDPKIYSDSYTTPYDKPGKEDWVEWHPPTGSAWDKYFKESTEFEKLQREVTMQMTLRLAKIKEYLWT